HATRLVFLANPDYPLYQRGAKAMQAATSSFGLQLHVLEVRNLPDDLDRRLPPSPASRRTLCSFQRSPSSSRIAPALSTSSPRAASQRYPMMNGLSKWGDSCLIRETCARNSAVSRS